MSLLNDWTNVIYLLRSLSVVFRGDAAHSGEQQGAPGQHPQHRPDPVSPPAAGPPVWPPSGPECSGPRSVSHWVRQMVEISENGGISQHALEGGVRISVSWD